MLLGGGLLRFNCPSKMSGQHKLKPAKARGNKSTHALYSNLLVQLISSPSQLRCSTFLYRIQPYLNPLIW